MDSILSEKEEKNLVKKLNRSIYELVSNQKHFQYLWLFISSTLMDVYKRN